MQLKKIRYELISDFNIWALGRYILCLFPVTFKENRKASQLYQKYNAKINYFSVTINLIVCNIKRSENII